MRPLTTALVIAYWFALAWVTIWLYFTGPTLLGGAVFIAGLVAFAEWIAFDSGREA